MKYFRSCHTGCAMALLVASAAWAGAAWAGMQWKDVEAESAIEAALYRLMPMPVNKVLGLRPPHEAVTALGELIRKQPSAELYSLRAMNEEAALEFDAAASDWKKYVETAPDNVQAHLALADFYHRRLLVTDELTALAAAAQSPASAAEKLATVEQQRSWQTFERIFTVIDENALPAATSSQHYQAWIARYPREQFPYERYFQFLLDHKMFAEAGKLIAQYHAAFATDEIFPVKARALLAYRSGSVTEGLAVYDTQFQPLWPQELVQSYFELMRETRSLRSFLDSARAANEKDPNNLNATARVFYYYQQQGQTDGAQQALTAYRLRKERLAAKWDSQELYALARLNETIHSYPEAARYYYALYNSGGPSDSQELALSGLASVLLDAPNEGIRLGAGELSMYRDIGSMDSGPGFLNGILSLVLNTTAPAYKYSEEEQRATPYFHRAEAAELIRMLDAKFAGSTHRPALHAQLLEAFSTYGESDAVIRDGKQFLAAFPQAPQREQVALLMADAYARTNHTPDEFALYDALLAELAGKAEGVPLGLDPSGSLPAAAPTPQAPPEGDEPANEDASAPVQPIRRRAFNLSSQQAKQVAPGVRSPEYSRVLERYLARLVSTEQVPQALAVLRKEIDRNPNDPGLYERLAQFLEQNRLGEQQEQVYQRAIQQFQDHSWYHKLARFYLREKRRAEFQTLSQQVIKIFSGTELEKYLGEIVTPRDLHIQLNEFAHARFPHDLVFVRNLLGIYHRSGGDPRWEALIRQHWWESEDLRNQFFEHLSRTGRLDQELASLTQLEASAQKSDWQALASGNPVAARFIGEAGFWQSHFEQAAPLMGALAKQFPADSELGLRASSVYRSLAPFDPNNTERAIAIEENLYAATPGDRDTLARIGDILADRDLLARAAPYWERMTRVRPGEPQAYLEPATVYWDYFDFNSALRLLNAGRSKLNDPALYCYEAGAIYETRHEYPAAIKEYLNGALSDGANSQARNRLLDLARRATLRDVVEQATSSLASGVAPDLEAVKLRISILEAENRDKEREQFMLGVAARTTSPDLLQWLEETAREKSQVAVQQSVLERQAAVTTDPVQRLELRLSLAKFHEEKKDIAAAQRNIDALYRDNTKILGVVRATVDFYWRNNNRQRAIQVLLQAAADSYPKLQEQFSYEAARKATDAGDYQQAHTLLDQLLTASPYNDEYLAASADAFARAGDDNGLKAFYLDRIEQFRKADLTQDARNRSIAALRRGLIPALTRMKDYSGATDQYIEIINRFPEDDALVAEAALRAQRNGRQQQLLKYYADTAAKSPRDYRWPMVLARIQMQLEDYPAAVESFAAAIKVRPDRVDLRTSRADLLERLMRFDDACAEYQRLFELNYHDTHWMEKIAAVRARQGKTAETVAALQVALVDKRPEKAENYFEVARRLESWNMLEAARDYAIKGVDTAGHDLLAVPEHHEGAALYALILTRMRQQDAAYQRLQTAVADATSVSSSVGVAVQQVEKQGIAAVTDKQWRDRALAIRRDAARSGLQSALRSMGKTTHEYFTPEERFAFAAFLESKAANASNDDLAAFFLPAAQDADLVELDSRWCERLMLAHYGPSSGTEYKTHLVDLQSRRHRFQPLGAQLERYAQTLDSGIRPSILLEAAHAYRSGASYEAELKVRDFLARTPYLNGEDQQRYFELLLHARPQQFADLVGGAYAGMRGDPAAQFVVTHGDIALARAVLAARGQAFPAVWTPAYTALAGLYLSDRTPATKTAFVSVLGDATIAERLAQPVDRARQLAGDIWFYYGSRYGEWLAVTGSAEAEDFLPAVLEESPGSASGYVTTAQFYADSGKLDRAIQDYSHALELAPGLANIHDRLAVLYARQRKRAEAIAEWKQALALLDSDVQMRAVPASFWPAMTAVLNHIGIFHVFPDLRPQADGVLRDYVRKNGTYRVDDLLLGAFRAAGPAQDGTAWLIDLAGVAPDPKSVLNLLSDATWIPAENLDPIYQGLLASLETHMRSTEGLAQGYAEQELRNARLRYVRYLLDQKQVDRARAQFQLVQKQEPVSSEELELGYRLAIANNQFDAILAGYRAAPEKAPALDVLRQAASTLRKDGFRRQSRSILEYAFGAEIAAHILSAPNMLGLAEIRLQDGDTPAALDLLRRLTLVVGQPFENFDAAASLLQRTGHHAEAVEFLSKQVQCSPWDSRARTLQAQEQLAASQDAATARASAEKVAKDSTAAYADRVNAALLLTGARSSTLGSGELDALATGALNPDQVDKWYYFTARTKAAEKAVPEVKVRLLEHAITDAPESDSVREPLFYALIGLGREQLAISALDPLLRANFLGYERSTPGEATGEDAEEDTQGDAVANRATTGSALTGRAALAVAVAKAYVKLEQLDSGVRYLRSAAKMDIPKAARTELLRNIADLRSVIRRNAANARRAPTIRPELEQDHAVRPRLMVASNKGGRAR